MEFEGGGFCCGGLGFESEGGGGGGEGVGEGVAMWPMEESTTTNYCFFAFSCVEF